MLALPLEVEFLPDPVNAVANWFLLARAHSLVTTGISSFSDTAALVSGGSIHPL